MIDAPAADAAADKYDTLAREEAAREKVLREKAEAEIQRLERESTIAAEKNRDAFVAALPACCCVPAGNLHITSVICGM